MLNEIAYWIGALFIVGAMLLTVVSVWDAALRKAYSAMKNTYYMILYVRFTHIAHARFKRTGKTDSSLIKALMWGMK
jgi:hypothetical protein